jgi:DNA-3-methyladenine glycosylase
MTVIITNHFFAKEPTEVAKELLGKVLRHTYHGIWLSAMIIETEAYYLKEKGSHASLGFTPKRKALFMDPGTIYMYYARGKDSINISCLGEGNALLIKSGIPYLKDAHPDMLQFMQALNPLQDCNRPREIEKLCSGQTLLCKALALKVVEWDQKTFDPTKLRIDDVGYQPKKIIQTKRLGIPEGRDEHLPYRFIDFHHASYCSKNPLSQRQANSDFFIHENV